MPSSGVQTCALRSEEHTSELQSHDNLVCRLLLEKTHHPPPPPPPPTPPPPAAPKSRGRHARSDRLLPYPNSVDTSFFFPLFVLFFFFFFNDRAPPEFSPFPLPAPLPI